MKKISAILLVLVMLLSMTAMAANDGSITVENTTKDVIYTIYKVFDATYAGDNVSYTYTKTGDTDALYAALTAAGSPFTLTATSTANVYNVSSEANAATISAWLTTNKAALTVTATKPGTGTEVVFDGLAYGYYYITTSTGSVVTVDSAIKDVTVVDKNENGPTAPEKTVDDENDGTQKGETATAGIGETVNYEVTGTLARYNGTVAIKSYTFKDTMSTGLTYNEDLVIVVDNETLVEGDDYTITETKNGYTLTLTTWTNDGFIYTVDAPYTITYTATVNENAVIDGNGNTNTVELTYNNDPSTKQEDTTVTKVYDFSFDKVTSDDAALTGAKFELAENGAVIKFTKVDNTYTVNPTGTVTTIEAGSVVIEGLDAGTYTLTETEAPAGYNKLTAPLSVVIAEDGTVTVDGETAQDGNFDVKNSTGSELPSTGGIGTTIFYVVGGLMMAAAVVLLVAKKKVSA